MFGYLIHLLYKCIMYIIFLLYAIHLLYFIIHVGIIRVVIQFVHFDNKYMFYVRSHLVYGLE